MYFQSVTQSNQFNTVKPRLHEQFLFACVDDQQIFVVKWQISNHFAQQRCPWKARVQSKMANVTRRHIGLTFNGSTSGQSSLSMARISSYSSFFVLRFLYM